MSWTHIARSKHWRRRRGLRPTIAFSFAPRTSLLSAVGPARGDGDDGPSICQHGHGLAAPTRSRICSRRCTGDDAAGQAAADGKPAAGLERQDEEMKRKCSTPGLARSRPFCVWGPTRTAPMQIARPVPVPSGCLSTSGEHIMRARCTQYSYLLRSHRSACMASWEGKKRPRRFTVRPDSSFSVPCRSISITGEASPRGASAVDTWQLARQRRATGRTRPHDQLGEPSTELPWRRGQHGDRNTRVNGPCLDPGDGYVTRMPARLQSPRCVSDVRCQVACVMLCGAHEAKREYERVGATAGGADN